MMWRIFWLLAFFVTSTAEAQVPDNNAAPAVAKHADVAPTRVEVVSMPEDHHSDIPLFWATVFLVLATTGLMIYTGLLYRQTKKLASDAQEIGTRAISVATDQLIAANRPWVGEQGARLNSISVLDVEGSENISVYLSYRMNLVNVGKSPAVEISIWCKPLLKIVDEPNDIFEPIWGLPDHGESNQTRNDLFKFVKAEVNSPKTKDSQDYSLFPDEEQILAADSETILRRKIGRLYGRVFGLISYRFGLDQEEVHYTNFSYDLPKLGEFFKNSKTGELEFREEKMATEEVLLRQSIQLSLVT